MAGLACGIVGLPNVGKSTLFNALTSVIAKASNFPFCTVEPNIGIVDVYDPRLEKLSEISKSQKILYATTKFVDIAGLVKGASRGEGLGNKFLGNIREVDAIVHVLRAFDDGNVTHVSGVVDPIADLEIVNLELILADLQMADQICERLAKQVKGRKELIPQLEFVRRAKAVLEEEKPVHSMTLTEEEREFLKFTPFLTAKPVLYVANVGESELQKENSHVQRLREYAETHGQQLLVLCARVEEEIHQLPEEEQALFLESLGLAESGLQRLIRSSFDMLGLHTFLTTGEMETRAWTIPKGTTAVEAAGKIHTDIQKGFIRAEVIAYNDFITCGGRVAAREAGLVRAEGKQYVIADGDVILFLHN